MKEKTTSTKFSLWILLLSLALLWPLASLMLARRFDAVPTPPTPIGSTRLSSFSTSEISRSYHPEDIVSAVQVANYLGQNENLSEISAIVRPTKQALLQQILEKHLPRVSSVGSQYELPLIAYLEPALPSYSNLTSARLPSRRHQSPNILTEIVYHSSFQRGCKDLPNDFPVQIPPTASQDDYNRKSLSQKCPVLEDPFLPWVHDAFVGPSSTSSSKKHSSQLFFHVIAHNQRRCHTDPKVFHERLAHLEPQVTLMQSVPVRRIFRVDEATQQRHIQYRLTSLEEADEDAKETRFICQFHTHLMLPLKRDGGANGPAVPKIQKVVAGETLSQFVYNYEHANYQKGQSAPMLTRPTLDKHNNTKDDKSAIHNENVWNSILHFQCPIPDLLSPLLTSSTPLKVYVDIVPIRTYPRLDRAGYFDRNTRNMTNGDVTFNPAVEWGTGENSLLPPIEASGRWANIPICLAPTGPHAGSDKGVTQNDSEPFRAVHRRNENVSSPKSSLIDATHSPKQFLVACVWASASYTTRGSSDADTSTSERLLEWLTFQLNLAGFDHVYVYDNSEATNSTVNLEPVTKLFSVSQVTRIPWKHPVCNNNRPGSRDPGERSSQYAAEASCRVRYGPSTQWMAVFDTDEYLIPQKPYTSIRHWLETNYGSDNPTKILSFFQTRALPNINYLDPIVSNDGEDLQFQWKQRPNATFLETYNCDKVTFPKPGWSWRAKKQIFQPSYVLQHYVHYSLVTKRLLDFPGEKSGFFKEHSPYEKRVDEQKEAFMLHAKTTAPMATQNWRKLCKTAKDCPIGIPYPSGNEGVSGKNDGFENNCYSHDRITVEFVPKLKRLMEPLREKFNRH